ncbi:hypothetical protein ACNKET_004815, partial [Escherichia coli]
MHPPVSAEPAGAVSGCRYGPMSEKPGLQRPFLSRPPAACFPAVDFPGAEAATTRFSRPGERCTSHKTFCRKRQKLLRLPPDNCPVPWQSLPHRKGPLRGETPKKWTAEGA